MRRGIERVPQGEASAVVQAEVGRSGAEKPVCFPTAHPPLALGSLLSGVILSMGRCVWALHGDRAAAPVAP